MKVSRRQLASVLGAGALSVQSVGSKRDAAETTRALLDAQGERGIFADPEWLDLLRRALELSLETRKMLRSYPIPDDVEPAIGFKRD